MAYRLTETHKPCPYNSAHQILPHRMAQHIIKCRKNHPELVMETCPFNATHVIPSKDYEAHILECPNKGIVERDIYRRQEVADAMDNKRKASTGSVDPLNNGEEDWEQEMAERDYNPLDTILKRNIPRQPPPGVLGKAGKKKWRKNQINQVRNPIGFPNQDLEDPNTSLTSNSFLSGACGGTSRANSVLANKDADKYSLTESKSNLAVCADEPLRRSNALQKNSTRNAANIFNDTLEENSKASEATGAVPKIQANKENAYASHIANVELTGDPGKDKKIKKLKKKLNDIAKLKIMQRDGKPLEKNQLDKIATEERLISELENLNS